MKSIQLTDTTPNLKRKMNISQRKTTISPPLINQKDIKAIYRNTKPKKQLTKNPTSLNHQKEGIEAETMAPPITGAKLLEPITKAKLPERTTNMVEITEYLKPSQNKLW